MAANNTRGGAPVSPTTTTEGAVGSADQVRTFLNSYTRPCIVVNKHATEELYVKVNDVNCSNTDYHFRIAALTEKEISFEGRLNVESVSLYYADTAAYTDALVFGWKP